jgi:hypothetical protein
MSVRVDGPKREIEDFPKAIEIRRCNGLKINSMTTVDERSIAPEQPRASDNDGLEDRLHVVRRTRDDL